MEGWVNLQGIAEVDGTPTGGILWNPRSSVGGTSSFLLGYTSEGIVRGEFNSRSQPGGIRHLLTEFTLPMNTWTHLAYVKDSMDVKLYINGEQVVRLIESGITSRGMPISLTALTVAQNIYGFFDDFRFSDEALAPNELGYFKPFTPIPPKSTVLIVH